MTAAVHLFGIRHHGPGSARRLVEALDALAPAIVLIEGPSDASDILPLIASSAMIPPVALLAYAAEDPGVASFWPFAEYSPERQAALWAARHGVEARFIDLPASWTLAQRLAARKEAASAPQDGPEDLPVDEPATDSPPRAPSPEPPAEPPAEPSSAPRLRADPIGALARAAGYEDGESWWRDVIEENPEPGSSAFEAIGRAMTALREAVDAEDARDAAGSGPDVAPGEALAEATPPDPDAAEEAAREAHMRLEIAKAAKEAQGPVAVVCGAWHVPALAAKSSAKADRALLTGRTKTKIVATWAPWTSPRLASASGYGAGVTAPGWCAHLWRTPREAVVPAWLARIAQALRARGHLVSTASLIEAQRLATALAAMRGRPQPGFEELRDAAIASLCFGETLLWSLIAPELLVGSEVGAIPPDVPLAPLLEDLQRQQKLARLKPEALERELSLDLRTESGLLRSTLLHRLTILDVPWGRETDAGGSRGTFRERWILRWEPEFAVKLVEQLVYGPTIETAAAGRLAARMAEEPDLGLLADLVFQAVVARLDQAAEAGVAALERKSAQTSDCLQLLLALPPVAGIVRYGEARRSDAAQLGDLARRLVAQAAIALPYAARGLDAAAARQLCDAVGGADRAVALLELRGDERALWLEALRTVADDPASTHRVSGTAARLLYEAEAMAADDAATFLGRMLSPGTPVADAAGCFEGFFEGAAQRLVFDAALRDAVDAWACSLEDETFTEHLPLFRRVLGALDRAERRRMLDALLGAGAQGLGGRRPASDGGAAWRAHYDVVERILIGGGAP